MTTIFKRTPEQLSERRIDPWHYQPRFERQINKIKDNLGALTLEAVIDSKRGVASGATPLGANYLEKGRVKFYRTSEVEEMFLQAEEAVFINDEDDEKLKRSRLVDGDVLLTITGAKFGKSAVVSAKHLPANISQHSVRFKPDPKKVDAHFLVAYLNSKTGQVAIWKEAYGATRPAIDFPSVRSLAVPKVLPLAQRYIGDKVRQAEQLRTWAKSIQQKASETFPAYINDIQRNETKKYRAKELFTERLDSVFYHPDYIALEDKMRAKGCKRLGLITKQVKGAWNKNKADTFEYYEIGGLDIITGQVSSVPTPTTDAPSRAKTKVQQGDVLVSTVRPNRKNVGFIVDNVTQSEMVATSGFSVLRFSSLTLAAFYHAWLRTDDATTQLMRWNSGSAYPAIDDNVPLNIITPDFEKTFVDGWGQKLLNAQFAYVYAKRLTEAAKNLVESLIEGQLTEQQLIKAQQALEDGDNSLDQAILSKLSAEGYAIEGATPLFSDVDELYSLLEDAAQAEAEE
ncbi:restriction endonuclease subunit S [Leclercia sp. CFBP8987]|uniref:restriction endonuclease subunit S n=1 Tax=Leclercia sp. CFBP8987 TaxID=3096525 RepID=UPI002A69FCEE|nr:restriction endonuclease subunit S [Leclercia sp. CFBP8987]MDY0921218.1 restriction endonuclease subunit S [Leclercia sp. CFBP8987]